METIILAGGKGTRLREVIADIPKPIAPVNGRPFLWFIFNWIKNYPIEKAIISIGPGSEKIKDYLQNSFNEIPVEYAIEEKPLGTGGAIRFALQKTIGDNILVLNGDTFFPIDLNRFISFHIKHRNLFTVALKPMKNFSRYGSVECSKNTLLRFNEKKFCSDGLINGGIYLINRYFIESRQLPDVFSLEKDLLEKDAGSSLLKCMRFENMFIDIGIPEDYRRAESILKDV